MTRSLKDELVSCIGIKIDPKQEADDPSATCLMRIALTVVQVSRAYLMETIFIGVVRFASLLWV